MKFVQRDGTFAIEMNSRSGTPILAMTNLINGNIIQVTANMNISNGNAAGVYIYIQPTNDKYCKAVSPTSAVVQNISGWTSTTRIAYFKVDGLDVNDPTVEVDFEVDFMANDLGGDGQRCNNFVLSGRVVDTED